MFVMLLKSLFNRISSKDSIDSQGMFLNTLELIAFTEFLIAVFCFWFENTETSLEW